MQLLKKSTHTNSQKKGHVAKKDEACLTWTQKFFEMCKRSGDRFLENLQGSFHNDVRKETR